MIFLSSVAPETRLFADDCILYRHITCTIQHATTYNWHSMLGMRFHPKKCYSLSITKSQTPFKHDVLHSHTRIRADSKVLRSYCTPSSNMSWELDINNITTKTNKCLGFLRRNLLKQEETKSLAYKSMVRSNLEYCSTILAPHTKKLKDKF